MIKLLDRESGKYISTRTHRIFRNRDWLLIIIIESDQTSDILITNDADMIVYPSGRLTLSTGKGVQPVEPNPFVAVLMQIRSNIHYCYVNGNRATILSPWNAKKKSSVVFIDRKLSVP